ncbi:MAG: undecaprenyldiphospho-muramoylpentapeptide beta-N-acetylglucosaminyltransferase [Muribaculaceae bacterium]|nr:undecaprenyldiphospho-muramoylpentapeptide beta-N-acetylglucosaminyltransferase [Muribaculaceae bacterium]
MSRLKQAPRVIVSGGGTGGHIFPAISIANEIRHRYPDAKILFIGAEGRMEMERVPKAGYEIVGLPVAGFDRKRLWRNFKVVAKLMKSMRKVKSVITGFDPDIVIGVGGYASGPALKTAQKKGYPTLIQEQNSYAGVTNKMLGKKADAICTAYENMDRFFPADKIILTGNPIRSSILEAGKTREEAKKALGFDASRPLVLVVGGSLGALTVNDSIAAGLDTFEKEGIQVMWQTGRYYADRFVPLADGRRGIKASAFIDDMALAYRAADLVVSRAGAGTISELQLLGCPSILVPSPNVAEDHQRKNALALADRGAAVMVPDGEARSRLVGEITSLVSDPDRLGQTGRAAKAMALPDAAARIVDRAEEIIISKRNKK